MLRSEFENLTFYNPTQEEWDIIEIVYTWHPMIPDVKGKMVFCELFQQGHMGLIFDMLPTAEMMMRLEKDITQCRRMEQEVLERKQKVLFEIDTEYGNAIRETKAKQNEMLELKNKYIIK